MAGSASRLLGALLAALLVAPALLGCDALGERGEPPPAPSAACVCGPDEDAPVVAVDWLGRGTLYAAAVVGRRGDLTGVRYADGDREWVEASRISDLPPLTGRSVTVWNRNSANAVTVTEERDGLVHARFSDGSHTWFARGMLYQLQAPNVAPPPPPPTDAPASSVRRPAAPETVQVGAWVLAYWDSGSGVNRSRPWLARVTSRSESSVHLSYRDGSEGEAPLTSVLRVFPAHYRPRTGERVWLGNAAGASGVVVGSRAGLFSVRVGEQNHWVEASDVLAAAPPAPRALIAVGSHVTALWHGNTPYHGDVARLDGAQVHVQWHDGSGPDPIPIDDVVEIWEAAGL